MTLRRLCSGVLVSAVVFAAVAVPSARAQATRPATEAALAGQKMMSMMQMHEQMMSAMKADDAKLEALVKTLNDARGEARVDALTAIVNEIVRQHRAEHGHMTEMMGRHAPAAADSAHGH